MREQPKGHALCTVHQSTDPFIDRSTEFFALDIDVTHSLLFTPDIVIVD